MQQKCFFRAIDLQIASVDERVEAVQLVAKMITVYKDSNLKKLITDSKLQGSGKSVKDLYLKFLCHFLISSGFVL